MDDLAEQAVDDLLDFAGVNEEVAAKLIMKAREPWFANENSEGEK
jgi:N utilization substance protein A